MFSSDLVTFLRLSWTGWSASYLQADTHVTVPQRVEGWVDLGTAESVEPVPKALYCSCFVTTVCHMGLILGCLAPQSDALSTLTWAVRGVVYWSSVHKIWQIRSWVHPKPAATAEYRRFFKGTGWSDVTARLLCSKRRQCHHWLFVLWW